MKIKKVTHADGSVSYVTGNIEIVKNKENKEQQQVTEIESDTIEAATNDL